MKESVNLFVIPNNCMKAFDLPFAKQYMYIEM